MKKNLKRTIITIINWCSHIYPPSIAKILKLRLDQFFTYWIAREFKSIGENPNIERPMYLKGGQYITIGERFGALNRLRLECWDEFAGCKFTPELIIGNDVKFNHNVHVGCINQIIIGNNVLFGSNILLTDHQHGFIDKRDINNSPAKRPLYSSGPVIIEDNVWIGENVAIMPNVTIGIGSVVGANSVVTKSFPKNSVLAGVPAKLIKTLNIEK